jgi:hypothetical protein
MKRRRNAPTLKLVSDSGLSWANQTLVICVNMIFPDIIDETSWARIRSLSPLCKRHEVSGSQMSGLLQDCKRATVRDFLRNVPTLEARGALQKWMPEVWQEAIVLREQLHKCHLLTISMYREACWVVQDLTMWFPVVIGGPFQYLGINEVHRDTTSVVLFSKDGRLCHHRSQETLCFSNLHRDWKLQVIMDTAKRVLANLALQTEYAPHGLGGDVAKIICAYVHGDVGHRFLVPKGLDGHILEVYSQLQNWVTLDMGMFFSSYAGPPSETLPDVQVPKHYGKRVS